jgi:hypothetical protein
MKFTVSFVIECGEQTCASEPGKFCHFLKWDLKGTGKCLMFGAIFDKDGWLIRHRDCLRLAKSDEPENT